MTYKTRKWLEGLLQAFFSGASATLGVIIVDPGDFGILDPEKLLNTGVVALIVGGVQLLQYLARTPLPEMEAGGTVGQTVLQSFAQRKGPDLAPEPKE